MIPVPAPAALYSEIVRKAVTDQDEALDTHTVSSLHLNPERTKISHATVGVIEVECHFLVLFSVFAQTVLEKHPDDPPDALFARMEMYLPEEAGGEYVKGEAREAIFACAADIHGRLWWAMADRDDDPAGVEIHHCFYQHPHRHEPGVIDALWSVAKAVGTRAYGMPPPVGLN
jgi:hypothetical protein